MVNALVWGFTDDNEKIINAIKENGAIDIKAWFSLDKEKYYLTSFTTDNNWFEKYHKEKATFNQTVYNKVVEFFHIFAECDSRVEQAKRNYFPLHYYLNKFNMLYDFIYAIFTEDKIEVCLFSNLPHEGTDFIIYAIAKAMGVKTVILTQSSIPNHYDKIFYLNDIEDYGDFHSMQKTYNNENAQIIENKVPFYMNQNKKAKNPIKLFFRRIKRKKPHELRYLEYKNNLKLLIKQPNYSKKYVYFPLHLQPELTTSTIGGIYRDQMLALERLSEIIPKDWLIYVKENPKQNEIRRDKLFFERFKLLKNVQMVPLDENSFTLTKGAQFVSTITGTAGFEALVENIPVLVFGQTWYQNFEGAFKYSPDFDINKIIKYKINREKLNQDLNNLVAKMPYGVIDPEYIQAIPNYDKEKSQKSISKVIEDMILAPV